MKTILVLMDSLNRHYLPVYGNDWVKAPNIQRLAERGIVFENHYCASMPCMPARRDLMNGRYNFLESPWGPIEPYDDCLPCELRGGRRIPKPATGEGAVYSHMVTDHYHYWEWYGLGYNCFYDTWEFLRGQEGDNEIPRVKAPDIPKCRGKGADRRQEWVNRANMDMEDDAQYPTPLSFERAADFLAHNHDADDWFLHLEVFDPHEPFTCSSKFRDMYGDRWDRDYVYDWPAYDKLDPEADDAEAVEHIRKQYAATLTRADECLGRLLDKMDECDLWDDTAVILTTDHGHMLGEHGFWAKNYMFEYRELVNTPLIIAAPGVPGGQRRHALTSAIDLMPTIMELHGKEPGKSVHGKSLVHLFEQDGDHHDAVLYGYFGKDIGMTDGRHTYCRQPVPGGICHHHTAMATHAIFRDRQDWSDTGMYLPHVDMPVYRVPIRSHRHRDAPDLNPIYDLHRDPWQENPVSDEALEQRLSDKLRELLIRYNAPECQFERTGLAGAGD